MVRARTEEDFVERDWLYDEIERALESERGQYVLVTGEPGAGKTSLLAGMARARPDRLRYFFRRDSRTALTGGDIQSFLLSIGHQLARVHPELFELESLTVVVQQHIDSVEAEGRVVGIRIEDLRVSPFQRTATLEVDQRLGVVAGTATGVEIGTAQLEPRLLDPDNLAHLALIGPAQVLAAQDPEARIVILLDALDEIADDTTEPRKGLLRWLARSPELPANVKVVMTSRPHSGLRLFRSAREERLTEMVVDAGSPQVVNDLRIYADRVLETDAVIAMERARGHLPGSAKRYAVRSAAGNFLYLATYARALNDAVAGQDDEMVDRLLVFSGIPGNLAGLYGFFVELAREELTPWPTSRTGEPAGWEGVGLPVIGVLTVAREALTEDQLTALSGTPVREEPARKVLESLRWLLDRRDDRIAFFHTSISEFLAGEEARKKHPECWVDETEWHEQIVRHYRGAAVSWAEVDWSQVDRYGLVHLVTHLLRARPRSLDEAVDLVCPGLRRAVRTEFGAQGRFLELVDSIAHHVADSAPVGSGLPALMYLGVVRHQAAQPGNALPTRVIGLLARTGRRQEALEYVAGMTPSSQRFTAVTEILAYARPRPDETSYEELLDLLVESVLTIPRHGTDYYRDAGAQSAAESAAQLLAPHDLERALRLWRHGQELSERAPRPEAEPDAVYRAAAVAEQDVDRARVLIGRISGERWTDYLDLAERADSGRSTELLWAAERSLDTVGPAVRVVALSRLASAWATYDPDTSRRFLAEVLAQVFAAGEEEKLAPQLTKAAVALRDVAPAAARILLARLDTIVVNGYTERALLDAAGLWTRWGAPERARTLVDRYLAWTSSPWAQLSARKALGQSDRAEERQLVEKVHADIPEPPADPTAYGWAARQRDDDLAGVVRRMAEYDLARAAQMARDVAGPSDRYVLLADIAHLHLDRGEASPAAALLEEVLQRVERPAPLRGAGGAGTGFTTASPESSAPPARNHLEQVNIGAVMGMFNLSHHWAARARGHFFREPADVVRAVELGPSSNTARVIRRFAVRLAHRDLSQAGTLMHSIADPGERAIGFAELHRAAHGPDSSDSHHGPEADTFSKEIDRSLGELPRHRWTAGPGDDSDEHKAWAYARPDLRVRFELAVRALGCRKADMQGLQGLTFLAHAQRHSMLTWASAVFAADMIQRKQPHQIFTQTHLENLTQGLDQGDEMSMSRVAAAAYHEYRIAREVPGYTFQAPKVHIDDPIYAAAVDLVTPAPGAPLSPSFTRRLRGLLDTGPLPAAAELVAFAAEARPENRHELRELAVEIIARARDGSAIGVDALAVLAASPALGDLVDPVGLVNEAERCTFGWPGEHWIPGDVVARLFPVLLERAPAVALRRFYEVASANWSFAMSLLEHAADALIDAMDTDLAATLGSAMARGLACTSPEGTAPDAVDGVRLAQLVATGTADNGRAS
ncbi:ATP-binding protein [Streptomyces lunaelactis]|uniref:ATP-binding protein n=1 Tax=Streptomyces lunaelactis TaxID=1535768 RepID=UPI00131ED77D|nr:ATP-binding protein [Streptomyces lunaelactis]NUK85228.1 ATP-binding protein [Streptomyces lunaelactis]